MVWGAITKDFKSKLIFVGVLNADSYCDMLDKSHFFDQARDALGEEWYFQQDDDVLVTNESNQDDEYDEYIPYSSSNDDIKLTEPNSEI